MGFLESGADLKIVDDKTGKEEVLKLKLAKKWPESCA